MFDYLLNLRMSISKMIFFYVKKILFVLDVRVRDFGGYLELLIKNF